MKRIFSIFIFLLSAFVYGQDTIVSSNNATGLQWLTNLEQAKKIAKEEKKPILLYMTGSDWCSPCKALKKDFFESTDFFEKSKNMILVEIDYPRAVDILSEDQFSYNKKVVAKYNKSKSFPTILILNSKGKTKDQISGYSSLRDTAPHFDFLNRNNI